MHYLIYKITNRLNNKIYVGKHKTENKDDDYFGSGLLLGRSIEKHGKENFTKEILFECSSEEEMNKKEADIVDEEFIARDDTYNVKLGGSGGFDYINKNQLNKTPIAIENHRKNSKPWIVREKNRDRWKNDEEFRREGLLKLKLFREKYLREHGNPFLGKHHTEETKKRVSASMLGKNKGPKNGVYGKHWVTNGTENKMVNNSIIPDGWRKGRV